MPSASEYRILPVAVDGRVCIYCVFRPADVSAFAFATSLTEARRLVERDVLRSACAICGDTDATVIGTAAASPQRRRYVGLALCATCLRVIDTDPAPIRRRAVAINQLALDIAARRRREEEESK